MKYTFNAMLVAAIVSLSPLAASGGIVTVDSMGPPPMGDFAADSFSTAGTGGTASQLQVADNRNNVGQSFTLGTAGQDSYLFNSITFEIQDQGATDETLNGLELNIYEVAGTDPIGTLLGSFGFGSGTFDASADNFVTFGLTAAESTTLGLLDAGTEYAATLTVQADEAANPAGGQFRIRREATGGDSYSGGNGIFNDVFVGGGTGTTDAVFQVNVTAVASSVPEPSSLALTGLGGMFMLGRRRKV